MISTVHLQHFRSYQDAAFTFNPSVTIIAGPNATGKTNLLEAVWVLARGSSFRAKDIDLVTFDADWARLDAETSVGVRTVKLQRSGDMAAKSFVLDDTALTRLAQSRTLSAVLFEPTHLSLLHGAPDGRRAFLDTLIEQTDPTYGATLRHYRRCLSQRNALLKKNPPHLAEQLFVWNIRLSELGGAIARRRHALVQDLSAGLPELYMTIAGADTPIAAAYASRFPLETYETSLLKKLEEHPEVEAARGFTAYGPHRDDLLVLLNNHPAQESASRGEVRTIVLALKVLELRLVESARQQKPLLLLDDVFSELDASRRHALTTFVQAYQTIITTTDADAVRSSFTDATLLQTKH